VFASNDEGIEQGLDPRTHLPIGPSKASILTAQAANFSVDHPPHRANNSRTNLASKVLKAHPDDGNPVASRPGKVGLT
jgi:hypothetical protein